ncbi:MAG TPA: tyrosine-type recombinase/integrase [Solirubrobacteraceae bacterium]|nr:tyrosine-type recombinase/integrase [Solirubrobacteraceae bacterium]
MARKRTGQLIWRKGWAYARVTTVINGEKVRPCKPLGTQNPVVARLKLQKLNAAENPASEDAKRPETFAEAAERIYAQRVAEVADPLQARSPQQEIAQLRRYALPIVGQMAVTAVSPAPADINTVLDAAKRQGLSRQSVQHLKQRLSNVFAALQREPGGRSDNPVDKATMPKFQETVTKERAVLSDEELVIYLEWEHADDRYRGAVLERQTMACVARMFGGLRTSDLHALKWEGFDVDQGGFAWGWAPRKKTKRPQLLEVPEMLRAILQAWWDQAGRPRQGVVFPVRRAGRRGNRVGQGRGKASHARALRRDLQRAFAASIERDGNAPRKGSQRWRELFEETDYTLPIDFHSWRRAYAQALADADVNAQQAAALAGHADLGAHARYLRNAGKMRTLPDAAVPRLRVPQRAHAKGSEASCGVSDRLEPGVRAEETAQLQSTGTDCEPVHRIPMLDVAGSNPAARSEKQAISVDQKALAMPNDSAVTAIPARPHVRLLDLLAAIDAAIIAGDAHAARALVAEAARLERERSEARGIGEPPSGAQSP